VLSVRGALIRFVVDSALSCLPGNVRPSVFWHLRRVSMVRPETLRISWLRVALHHHLLIGTFTLRYAAARAGPGAAG